MKRNLLLFALLILLFSYQINAQDASTNCFDAPTLCNLGEIDGFTVTMEDEISPGTQPIPLCPGDPNSGPHNIFWFSWVASSTPIVVDVAVSNCGGGSSGNGVQSGIYTDCSFTETVYCNSGSITTDFTITADVVIGQTYFMFFDGFAGSVCDIVVDVIQGGDPYEVPDPTSPILDYNFSFEDFLDCPGPCGEICQGGEINFTFPTTAEGQGLDYIWTIDPPTSDYPTGIIDLTTFTGVLDFSDVGTYTICGQAVTPCDESELSCATFEVLPAPDDDLGIWEVCENDFPSAGPPDWLGNQLNGPGIYAVDVESPSYSCDYQQTIEVVALPLPEPFELEDMTCESVYQVCNDVFVSSQDGTEVFCDDMAANGCDSTVLVTLDFAYAIGFLAQPVCEDGNFIFTYNGSIAPATADITFNLYNDGNIVYSGTGSPIGTEIIVPIQEGNYFLEIIVTQFGTSCTFFSDNISIVDNGLIPVEPEPNAWSINPCVLDVVTYELAPNADPSSTYNWTITPNDPGLVITDNGTEFTIDWSTSSFDFYTICVAEDNGCALGPELCVDIEVLQAPEANFATADTVCINTATTVQYTGTVLGAGTYNWNFDGGSTDPSDITTSGPYDVTYSSPGWKYISLNVSEGSCASPQFIDSVFVTSPLSAATVNCESTVNSIIFTWNNVPNSNGYTVSVVNAPGTATVDIDVDNQTVEVTGLSAGETVTILIEVLGLGYCANTSQEYTCEAIDCPPVEVTIEEVDSICLVQGTAEMMLEATTDVGGSGDITWSGPGILDADTGEFDPNTAGAGSHTIVATYSEDGCNYSDDIIIDIFEQPVSSFSSLDTICIEDNLDVSYTGTFSTGTLTWNFDLGNVESGTGAGPYEISWDTPGIKTITIQTEANGCVSDLFTKEVLVQPALEEPIIDCEESTNDITFTWNDVPNSTGYEVIINSVSEGIQTGTSFYVDGLIPGDNVSIVVVAQSDNLCPNVSSTVECQASLCPNVTLEMSPDQDEICFDESMPIIPIALDYQNGEAGAALTWEGPGIDQNGNFDPNVAGIGTHEIVINYNYLNCDESDTTYISVLETPTASFFTETSICAGDTIDLNFDGSFVDSIQYYWDAIGGTIIGNQAPYQATFDVPGTYDIELIVDEFGCASDPYIVAIDVDEPLQEPEFSCDPTTDQVTFSWTDVDCASEYIIFINGNEVATQSSTTYEVTGLEEGENVDLEIVAVSECACGDETFNFSCEAADCPDAIVEIQDVEQYCQSELPSVIQLDVLVSGTDGSEEIEWIGDNISSEGLFDPIAAGVGIHEVTAIASIYENCTFTDDYIITIFENPGLEINALDPNCPQESNGMLEITPMDGSGPYEVTINGTDVDEFDLEALSSGTYSIEVIDDNGCVAQEAVTLLEPAVQNVSISGSNSIVLGESADLSIDVSVNADDIDNIVWVDAAGSIVCEGADCLTISPTPQEDNTYCVTLTYNGGCIIEDCIEVRVFKIKSVYIPNIFTPNGDNINDQFFIDVNNEIEEISSVQIFDRWGNKVYEKENVTLNQDPDSWDGTHNGKEVSQGVYIYLVEIKFVDGSTELFKGDIAVLR